MLLVTIVSSRGGHLRDLCQAAAAAYRDGGGKSVIMECGSRVELAEVLPHAASVIFASPTHLGGPSHEFAAFAEWTSSLRADGLLAGRWAAGITCGLAPDGGKTGTLTYLMGLALQHSMLWVGLDTPPRQGRFGDSDAVDNPEGARLGVSATLVDGGVSTSARLTAYSLGRRLARLGEAPDRTRSRTQEQRA